GGAPRDGPQGQGPVKVPALPHGRAIEQAAAQVSSPRVSKGCASPQLSYGTLTGPCLPNIHALTPEGRHGIYSEFDEASYHRSANPLTLLGTTSGTDCLCIKICFLEALYETQF